jgi:hypothetical protein
MDFIFLGSRQSLHAEPGSSPKVSCQLIVGLLTELHGHIDDPKTNFVEVSNLHRIPIKVLVSPVPRPALEPLRLEATGKDSKEGGDPTIEITVNRISNNKRESVPAKLSRIGSGGDRDEEFLEANLEIPIDPAKRKTNIVEYLKKIGEGSEKESRGEEFRRLTRDMEATIAGFEKMYMQNEVGEYEINCQYRSHREGFWNGEIKSSVPLRLKVVYQGEFFDQPKFKLQ